jgi:hypothetical protein
MVFTVPYDNLIAGIAVYGRAQGRICRPWLGMKVYAVVSRPVAKMNRQIAGACRQHPRSEPFGSGIFCFPAQLHGELRMMDENGLS